MQKYHIRLKTSTFDSSKFRSNPPEVFLAKGFLKCAANSQEHTHTWRSVACFLKVDKEATGRQRFHAHSLVMKRNKVSFLKGIRTELLNCMKVKLWLLACMNYLNAVVKM